MHSLLFQWDQGREALTDRDVLVVDEAGMIGSRQMERLLSHARTAGAKVVLVGDPEQLQAIEAGAAFRAIAERVGAIEITEIRRQRADGKMMHEFAQSADLVDWKSTPYFYASADSTPLFVMAMEDYVNASGDAAFLRRHWDAVRRAYAGRAASIGHQQRRSNAIRNRERHNFDGGKYFDAASRQRLCRCGQRIHAKGYRNWFLGIDVRYRFGIADWRQRAHHHVQHSARMYCSRDGGGRCSCR